MRSQWVISFSIFAIIAATSLVGCISDSSNNSGESSVAAGLSSGDQPWWMTLSSSSVISGTSVPTSVPVDSLSSVSLSSSSLLVNPSSSVATYSGLSFAIIGGSSQGGIENDPTVSSVTPIVSSSAGLSSSAMVSSAVSSSSAITPPAMVGYKLPLGDSADYLFDQDHLRTYHLILDPDSLDSLNSDPEGDEYVSGYIAFEGDTIGPVGIKYDGAGCTPGRGPKTCPKLSMKVKLTMGASDFRLYGKKRLNFLSMNKDASQLHERLGFWLFRKMGVVAPRSVNAKIYVNGVYAGLFNHVEYPDGKFTKAHFTTNGDGNLYKEVWPLDSTGAAQNGIAYVKALKTNDDVPDFTILDNFAKDMQSSTVANVPTFLDLWMDTDNLMAYIAVDRAIRADEGLFHWDCNPALSDCKPDNYYWYEAGASSLYLVPWDLDKAFENISGEVNSETWIPDHWTATSNGCQPFAQGTDNQVSAACDKIIAGMATYSSKYIGAQLALGNILDDAPLLVDFWAQQLRTATQEAEQLHGAGALSEAEWDAAVSQLKADLATAKSKLP